MRYDELWCALKDRVLSPYCNQGRFEGKGGGRCDALARRESRGATYYFFHGSLRSQSSINCTSTSCRYMARAHSILTQRATAPFVPLIRRRTCVYSGPAALTEGPCGHATRCLGLLCGSPRTFTGAPVPEPPTHDSPADMCDSLTSHAAR